MRLSWIHFLLLLLFVSHGSLTLRSSHLRHMLSNLVTSLLFVNFQPPTGYKARYDSHHRGGLRNQPHHDDVIKWKHFPRNWPFVRGSHRSPVNSPHKGQWRGALVFSLVCVWINDWVNNREAGDLRRYRAHYDVIVMIQYAALSGALRSVSNLTKFVIQTCGGSHRLVPIKQETSIYSDHSRHEFVK